MNFPDRPMARHRARPGLLALRHPIASGRAGQGFKRSRWLAGTQPVRVVVAVVMLAISLGAAMPAHADEPLPIIATYELHKARTAAQAAARDPKGFWVGQIVGRIEDRKPLLNLALKAPATVSVSFVVARDGRLVSSTVSRSSGDAALDRRAVDVLASAAPFPPMPQALPDDSMSFTVPLRFK